MSDLRVDATTFPREFRADLARRANTEPVEIANAETLPEPCPFCGQYEARICEDVDRESGEHFGQFQAVCSFTRGGCGASTGFKGSMRAARHLWKIRRPPGSSRALPNDQAYIPYQGL